MADGNLSVTHLRPTAETIEVARLLRHASHPIRLILLHALSGGQRSVSLLARDLGETCSGHLNILVRARIVRRWSEGQQKICSLTPSGARLIEAYHIIADNDVRAVRPPLASPESTRQPDTHPPPTHLINAAQLLNHAAHPLRLEILFMLSEGSKTAQELACALEAASHANIVTQLANLRDGALVDSRKVGRPNMYTITDGGLSVVQVIRATCSSLAVRRGNLTLVPQPITPGVTALHPTSPEGLACLLRSFADPLRLRLLNLLGGGEGVCVCHLGEVLGLPVKKIKLILEYPVANRSVVEEQQGQWVTFRLSTSALKLYQSLMGCFGPRLSNIELLHSDRMRLLSLSPCTVPLEIKEISSQNAHRIIRRA
jgi:ArsR family transcriptional regulator